MKDFLKIFFLLAVLFTAFIAGRNYGEKTFLQSEEYKKISSLQTELDFTKSEIENTKTKLQNILDGSSNKKTEELLAQILQVFLADLGLRLQNKELLVKKTEAVPTEPVAQLPKPPMPDVNKPVEKKTLNWTKSKPIDFQLSETRLVRARSEQQILQLLDRVKISSLDHYFKLSEAGSVADFTEMQGLYKGKILDRNKTRYGTLSFRFLVRHNRIAGEIAFSSERHGSGTRSFEEERLGQKIQGFTALVIEQNQNKYFQFYKLDHQRRFVGNYYEKLPNGTTNLIGHFILNRVDQF